MAMKASFLRQTGKGLVVIGIVLFFVQIVLWAAGDAGAVLRTGSVFSPLMSLLGFDRVLASHSMRGVAVITEWIFRTHLYLVCLVSGIFLTSMDGRLQN